MRNFKGKLFSIKYSLSVQQSCDSYLEILWNYDFAEYNYVLAYCFIFSTSEQCFLI